jgi:hypothetical protein
MLTTSSLFAQMNYWTTPAKKWNMSPSTPTSTALPGGASAYSVANGAYDENGDLLFYVQDMQVIDASGSFVGFLPTQNAPESDCHDALNEIGGEIAIVPIPGTCKQFYVIYSLYGHMSHSKLVYVKVNCSTGNPSITYNGSALVYCFNNWMSVDQPFVLTGHSGSDNIAFAVSKVYTGTGATAKRFLLSVSGTGIVRSEISSSGISSGSITASYTALGLTAYNDFSGIEAEISWGSNKFAWSSDNGTVHIININSDGQAIIPYTIQNYTISGAKGIEFSNSTSSPYLYVAAASDIKRIKTSNQTYTSISWGSNDLSNTFLEYGKNNRIYGVSPVYSGGTLIGSKLVGIISTFVLPGVTADIDSRYIPATYLEGVFTLPDQIDGEDYSYFNGIPAVSITNFTLNTNMVSNVCDNGTDKYCQNAAIEFNATYSGGTPDEYKIIIEAYHHNTCVPTKLTGAGYIDYQGSWTSGTPTANLDLRTLTDGNGLNLGNIDGTVKITYAIKDACGKEDTYVRYIQILNPVAPSIALEIYDYTNPQNYLTPSHNIGSPNLVGTSSLGYRINSSTGSISAMTVLIEEVDNTGAYIQTIYNKTTNISDVSGLTYENLNGYCIGSSVWGFNPGFGSCAGGYTGYFSYTNGQLSYGNYYKLTVTISNQCNTSSNWAYMYASAINQRIVNPNQKEFVNDANNVENEKVILYPNPVSNQLTIEFNNETDNVVEILLTDVLGKQTTTLMPSTTIKTGIFNQTFDVSKLPNGMYTYQIKLNNTIKTGMISKQ